MTRIYLLLDIPRGAAADVSPGAERLPHLAALAVDVLTMAIPPSIYGYGGGRKRLHGWACTVHSAARSRRIGAVDTFVDMRRTHVFFLIARQSF